MRIDRVSHYYVRSLAKVLRKPMRAVAFGLASLMHAAGHALLALAAGSLAAALAEGWKMVPGGSIPLDGRGPVPGAAFSLALMGLLAVVVKGAGGVYASYVQATIASEVGGALRLDVLSGLLAAYRLRAPRHDDQGVAQGVFALTAHVKEVEVGLHAGVLGGIRAATQLVPLLGILVWLAPKLAFFAVAVFVPFSIALAHVRRKWKRANQRAAREGAAMLEASDEAVRHADLWVTYGAERKVRANVASLGKLMAERAARLEASAAALSAGNEILGAIALVLTMGAAKLGLLGDAGDDGRLLGFAIAFFLAYKPLRDLADARFALTRASSAFAEVRGFLGAENGARGEVDDIGVRTGDAAWPLATLELRGVEVLRGSLAPITLTVGAGEIVVLSGPTGAGKTTLLRTLLGLEPPRAGEIFFDGVSLAKAAAGPLGRPFAWVPQDAPLLADTLLANVGLGATGVDARAALEPLGAAHLVDRLDGARLGAAGRSVSGGERQWIALARAIATELPVLLLDEPTSGLDARAQAVVLEGIARLRGFRSVLMVTHRPEPLTIADRVVRVG